jgi:Tfp pilus assembly protein PilO
MDPLLLIVGVVILVGIGLFASGKLDVNKDGKVDRNDFDAAVDSAEAAVEKKVTKIKAEVKEAVAEVKAKLPTAAKLKALTKAQLEDLGREFGIELDKRKTKDKMIADLKSGHKKLK